jgi:hypothetical protein
MFQIKVIGVNEIHILLFTNFQFYEMFLKTFITFIFVYSRGYCEKKEIKFT